METGHGRLEFRKIIVALSTAGIDFPYLGQAFLIQRVTIEEKTGKFAINGCLA